MILALPLALITGIGAVLFLWLAVVEASVETRERRLQAKFPDCIVKVEMPSPLQYVSYVECPTVAEDEL